MSYNIKLKQSCQKNLRRIAQDQVAKAVDKATDKNLSQGKRVHQARKRCKKLRALLRLFRPGFPDTYEAENRVFRDAAKIFSCIRDADALGECYDKLMECFREEIDLPAMSPLRRKLTLRRNALVEESPDMDAQLGDFSELLSSAAGRVDKWEVEDPRQAIMNGAAKTYRRGRKAMQEAMQEPTDEQLHELRKRVNYTRYQFKILSSAWPAVLHPLRRQYKHVSDLLGDDHDLALLRHTVLDDNEDFHENSRREALVGLIDRRRAMLQAEAFELGEELYVLKPKAFRKWIGAMIG